jgi:hypothetical protein
LNEKITNLEHSAGQAIQQNVIKPAKEALGTAKQAVNETTEGKRLILIGTSNLTSLEEA